MGALRALGAALAWLALSLPSGVSAQQVERWRPLAAEAAARFGLPEEWVLAVIAAESAGRTEIGGRPTISHAGAMGLMQIMPGTWSDLRAAHGLGGNPHNPRDNIIAGTSYLRAMYDRFGYPGLFAAYNAGPGRYGEYVSRGRPLPRETRDYVAKIVGRANSADMMAPARAAASASVARVIFSPAPATAPALVSAPVGFGRPAVTASAAAAPRAAASDAEAAVPVAPVDPIFLLRHDSAAERE